MHQDVVMELSEFMKLSGKSQQQIAKETALSASVISQFLNQTYKGNNDEVAKTIVKYLEMARLRITGTEHACFHKDMYNTKSVTFSCFHAHRHGDMALVFGDAGAGKTTALEHYANDHTGVVMVTANACTSSAVSVLQMIGRKTGRTFSGKKELVMSSLVDYFRNTHRLIIIDEADHLTMAALQAVRNLNDQAGVGIVFSGNTKIYTQMLQGSKCSELEQLRTRITVWNMVKNEYNWAKIAQDTHFTYQKAICQTMAERQARQIQQEKAHKTKRAKNTQTEITNLLAFRKRQAYA